MRQASSSALVDLDRSASDFGTGLRARLSLARTQREQAEYLGTVLELRQASRRDFSPELALVSTDFSLGELILEAEVARDAPLGTLLAEAGLLEPAELDFALACAREDGRRLGEVLVEQGFVSPAEVVRVVAAQRGLPFVDVRRIAVDHTAARLLPAALAHESRALPVGFVRGLPVVAVADPTDEDVMHGARSVLHSVRFVASPEDAILFQLARVYLGPLP
jgi:Type II secretion system (T2SS), protein E, N-terminal domain